MIGRDDDILPNLQDCMPNCPELSATLHDQVFTRLGEITNSLISGHQLLDDTTSISIGCSVFCHTTLHWEMVFVAWQLSQYQNC